MSGCNVSPAVRLATAALHWLSLYIYISCIDIDSCAYCLLHSHGYPLKTTTNHFGKDLRRVSWRCWPRPAPRSAEDALSQRALASQCKRFCAVANIICMGSLSKYSLPFLWPTKIHVHGWEEGLGLTSNLVFQRKTPVQSCHRFQKSWTEPTCHPKNQRPKVFFQQLLPF